MIACSCHCGAVRLTVPRAPEHLTDCNCTICRRYSTLWGYFSPTEVTITGATDVYLRGEKKIEFHRCKSCGCVTHWAPVDKTRDRMGVNFRMAEPAAIAGVRVRKLDGLDTWKILDE
jgi:hypothetical protein